MRTGLALAAVLTMLAGCQNVYPDATLDADSEQEGRCAAIRSNIPLAERGTRSDPTTYRSSLCSSGSRVLAAQGPGIGSPLYPVYAVYDAATTD